MMSATLFLLFFLTGYVFATEPPGVDCMVINLEYVHCSWNRNWTPKANYTFFSRFYHEEFKKCASYVLENSMNIGCNQPYSDISWKRFNSFYTKLEYDNKSFTKEHSLQKEVKLNPPTNLTVLKGTDSNLWFYWNHTATRCVESEIRYRIDNSNWEVSKLGSGKQNYCINLPSSSSQYEVQVRSTVDKDCGNSHYWSDWSQPVVWGSMRKSNGTDPHQLSDSMSVWTPLMYLAGAVTLILLVMMLMYHERLRIILIPIVPDPHNKLGGILKDHNVEDWLPIPESMKKGFHANFNERACPVSECSTISESDSESSDNSALSVTTDQTDCSTSNPGTDSEDPSTSSCTLLMSSEE
ncbi:cytokine receptor common subunit gamma-like [Thalassophryne amazonica]|uniref:cytokine receptor common subunit gamma-like n=1 Tax=Thalassophryne amazonica TaxID=390379 RepID=UPI001470A45D|nr:cytokine receptor common subunit gamma-like [Thalassophryne amazonica]